MVDNDNDALELDDVQMTPNTYNAGDWVMRKDDNGRKEWKNSRTNERRYTDPEQTPMISYTGTQTTTATGELSEAIVLCSKISLGCRSHMHIESNSHYKCERCFNMSVRGHMGGHKAHWHCEHPDTESGKVYKKKYGKNPHGSDVCFNCIPIPKDGLTAIDIPGYTDTSKGAIETRTGVDTSNSIDLESGGYGQGQGQGGQSFLEQLRQQAILQKVNTYSTSTVGDASYPKVETRSNMEHTKYLNDHEEIGVGVFTEDARLGCMYGLRRDFGDQCIGWFLYLVFLALSTWGWLGVTGYVKAMSHHYLLIIIPYCVKVLEGFTCPTFKYLIQAQTIAEMSINDQLIRDQLPVITWNMVCSHTETRTRHVTDKDGHSHTETYTVTIVTHTAYEEVKYTGCEDITPELPKEETLNKNNLTKMELDVNFAGDYTNICNAWKAFHHRDQDCSFTCVKTLKGLMKHSLLHRNHGIGFINSFANIYIYTFFLLTGYFGMPYRVWLSSVTDKIHFDYIKKITGITNKCRY